MCYTIFTHLSIAKTLNYFELYIGIYISLQIVLLKCKKIVYLTSFHRVAYIEVICYKVTIYQSFFHPNHQSISLYNGTQQAKQPTTPSILPSHSISYVIHFNIITLTSFGCCRRDNVLEMIAALEDEAGGWDACPQYTLHARSLE